MADDLGKRLDEFVAKPAVWLFGQVRDRVWVYLKPCVAPIDVWLSDKIDSWRKSSQEREAGAGKGFRKVEIFIVAILLVQFAPLAAGLVPAALCSFSAVLTLPFLLFGRAPVCSGDGWLAHLLALLSTSLSALVLWGLLRWSLAVVNDIQASRAKVYTTPARPTRALIMGLSEWFADKDGKPGIHLAAEEAARWAGNWREYVKPGQGGGNWQQSLRRIAASIDTLEVIYVLPSTESSLQFKAFKAYAATIFGRDDLPIREVTGVDGRAFGAALEDKVVLDYENYDAVSDGLERALLLAGGAIKELGRSETCIDITAGQKVFSIAGGILTLNGGLMFSYVTTQPRHLAGEVKYYDAELVFPGKLDSTISNLKG